MCLLPVSFPPHVLFSFCPVVRVLRALCRGRRCCCCRCLVLCKYDGCMLHYMHHVETRDQSHMDNNTHAFLAKRGKKQKSVRCVKNNDVMACSALEEIQAAPAHRIDQTTIRYMHLRGVCKDTHSTTQTGCKCSKDIKRDGAQWRRSWSVAYIAVAIHTHTHLGGGGWKNTGAWKTQVGMEKKTSRYTCM